MFNWSWLLISALNVSKGFCDGEKQLFFEKRDGNQVPCVRLLQKYYLSEILHTSANIQTTKNGET